ncbi:MAG TPA: nuclear transport factor 2 family protein, partial [Solirubrobacteraceae bacterium]|nr:nuclear transport factor 2 family protein [Solirubrobacteraceae bacterium]
MSQENVEIVRRSNECRSRGDLAGALVAVHPDVEWLDIREPVLAPEARVGAASLRSALEQWLAALDGFTTEVEGLIDEGDFVFVTSRWLGKCKGSGLS